MFSKKKKSSFAVGVVTCSLVVYEQPHFLECSQQSLVFQGFYFAVRVVICSAKK